MPDLVRVKKIVETKNIKNAEAILRHKDFQVPMYEEDYITVPKDGGYIILDFGKEMCGGIKLSIYSIESDEMLAKIRVRFGESLTEACSDIGEKNSTNHHAPRDFEAMLTSSRSMVSFGETGYRFVRIDFYPGVEVQLKTIMGTNSILRKRAEYLYKGNDKKIEKIFKTAKRTVDLCSGSGYIWDGIKRDRLIWIGDLYPEILSLTSMYGKLDIIERTLDFERVRTKANKSWLCGLNTYNMWWVACVSEYYLRVGDEAKEFTLSQIDYLYENIRLFNSMTDEDGTINCIDGTEFFVDWPSRYTEDEKVGSKFITIIAIKKAKKVLEKLKQDTKEADELLEKLLKGNMEVKDKKQVLGLKYAALGKLSDEEYNKLINGGAKGFSTFMSYFILTAIASRDKKLAIDLMKDYYGAMLDKGATTFWEDFDMEWVDGSSKIDRFPKNGEKDIHGDFGKFCYIGFRHSLCHAWSSGVIAFIKEYCD